MITKLNLNLFIIGYIILLPLFLSFSENSISLSRVAYYDNNKYFFTLSLNLILVIIIFRKHLLNSFLRLINTNIFLISIFILLFKLIVDFNLSSLLLKNIIGLLMFVFVVNLSSVYFINRPNYISLKNLNYLFVMPSITHITVILANLIIFKKETYIFESFVIYNLHQYLAFAFLPALYVFRNWSLRIISTLLIITLTIHTSNYTASLVIVLYFVLRLIPLSVLKLNYQIYIFIYLSLIISFMGFSYPFWGIESLIAETTGQYGFSSRVEIIKTFFSNLNYQNFIFPFLESNDFFEKSEFHSQYINLYYSFGIFIFFLYFKVLVFLVNLYKLNADLAFIGLSLLLISSFSVNILLHPYTLVSLGVLAGYLLSNIKYYENIKNV